MSDERNNGLFGGNEPIDLGSDANFTDLPDFSSDDFDSIFGTAERKTKLKLKVQKLRVKHLHLLQPINRRKHTQMKKQQPYHSRQPMQKLKQQNLMSQAINRRSRILLKRHWHRQTKNRQKRTRAA